MCQFVKHFHTFLFCILFATQAIPACLSEEANVRRTPAVRAVGKILPCVVNISTEQILRVSDPFEAFFNEFFGRHPAKYQRESIPLGSGIMVDCGGLVLTNYHVIQRASTIQIRLLNGQSFPARYVAGDAANDMALLQIQTDALRLPKHDLDFALPGDLLLGETVIAVGNPFGLGHSVTSGVLSAVNRSLTTDQKTFNDIIQTDAAINPGNSGGPLINLDGQLIGMNLAIRRDAEGIGFAIPLKRLEDVLASWLIPSRFSSAYCGFTPTTHLNGQNMEVHVAEVEKDSPAAKAGLKPGHVITAVNGKDVQRALQVGQILWKQTIGNRLQLTLRGRAAPITITISDMSPATLAKQRLGLHLQELTQPLLKALGLPQTIKGLAISDVLPNSPLASANIRRGDIIVGLGQQKTTSLNDIHKALQGKQPGLNVPIYLITVETIQGRILLRQVALDITLQ